MIAHLSGKLLSKTPTHSVIDCQGVGYEVLHTPFCAETLKGDQVSLFIHTNVREDALQLFGFSSNEERALFRELLKVNGIGPKMALSIMSGIGYSDLLQAISSKDLGRLQKIPGIGKKTAERLSIELADRIGKMAEGPVGASLASPNRETELESVLINLGYQRVEISKALKTLRGREKDFDQSPLETMVKSTLRELTQGKSL